MAYHVFFGLSTGTKYSMWAPVGTFQQLRDHVQWVERTLNLVSDGKCWARTNFENVADETLCETARQHNDWVRYLYRRMDDWKREPEAGLEEITPEMMTTVWHGLAMVEVPPDRWTVDYYVDRSRHLYEVMRGNESEGVSFDAEPLTPRQAAAVTRLFSEFLNSGDSDLDVPNGHDRLANRYEGEYDWCEECGPIDEDDTCAHLIVAGFRESYCHHCEWMTPASGRLEESDLCEHLRSLKWCDECGWSGKRDANGLCEHLRGDSRDDSSLSYDVGSGGTERGWALTRPTKSQCWCMTARL